MPTLAMTTAQVVEFLAREFPQISNDLAIDRITPDETVVRLRVDDRHLRPGGTVSGPAMFALADVAFYVAILARIGPVGLAVTTNATIDFLRKPAAGVDLVATATLLKVGKVLAVGEAHIRNPGSSDVVARASMTYSIPPKESLRPGDRARLTDP